MDDPLFAADPRNLLKIVVLDTLTALYHRPSGQTHIVSEPLPEILAALGADPMTADALFSKLFEDVGPMTEGQEALDARLAELEAIGLVSRR